MNTQLEGVLSAPLCVSGQLLECYACQKAGRLLEPESRGGRWRCPQGGSPEPRIQTGEWGGRLARRDSGGRGALETCLPTVRIGAYNLPSSMDLRTFLEDMQARSEASCITEQPRRSPAS